MPPGVLVQLAVEDPSVEGLLQDLFVKIKGNELLYASENA
jgi:hypothetical protein